MDEKKLILKIQKNKGNGQKFINIPKNRDDLLEDDYVLVKKVVDNNKE